MKQFRLILAALSLIALAPAAAFSVTIDVLWTSGTANYDQSVQNVANRAATYDPDGNGALTWNLTMWDGTSDPGFSNFDVLVVGSTCNVDANCSGAGFFGNGVYATGVMTYSAQIAAARGSRTFLSGQDADFHNLNNLPNVDNGPQGFMINAVNWAASGTGLGIVSMTDRITTGGVNNGWWTEPGSFLASEFTNSDVFLLNSQIVNIGAGQENFPVNEGLTSQGLSNWNTSSHACFNEVAGYARINFAPFSGGDCGVTIVTAGEQGGDTDGGDTPPGAIPLPATVWLMLAGFGGLGLLRRRS